MTARRALALLAGVLLCGGAAAHDGGVAVLYQEGEFEDSDIQFEGFAVQMRAPLAPTIDLAIDYSQLDFDESDGGAVTIRGEARRWSVGAVALLPSPHRPVAGVVGAAYEHAEGEAEFGTPPDTVTDEGSSDGYSLRGGVRLDGNGVVAELTYHYVECTTCDDPGDDSDTRFGRIDLTIPVAARLALAGRYDQYFEDDDEAEYAEWSAGLRWQWGHRAPRGHRGRERR